MNDPKLTPAHLSAVPIIGRRLDEKGIAIVKDVLAKLERGELLNVAIVGETDKGDMTMAFSFGMGAPIKLRGALATLGTHADMSIIGGQR
jgi:hypothetical protein